MAEPFTMPSRLEFFCRCEIVGAPPEEQFELGRIEVYKDLATYGLTQEVVPPGGGEPVPMLVNGLRVSEIGPIRSNSAPPPPPMGEVDPPENWDYAYHANFWVVEPLLSEFPVPVPSSFASLDEEEKWWWDCQEVLKKIKSGGKKAKVQKTKVSKIPPGYGKALGDVKLLYYYPRRVETRANVWA